MRFQEAGEEFIMRQFINCAGHVACMGERRKLVKLSLCLTKHHAMKAYWGVEV
jgi:hypothetical protein